MAICIDCGLEMSKPPADACTIDGHTVGGKLLARIPYGADQDMRCHDCGVLPGGLHHYGCDAEECPRCHGQMITCKCKRYPHPEMLADPIVATMGSPEARFLAAMFATDKQPPVPEKPVDLYDLGEFLSTVQQSISSETGEYNSRTAPMTLAEIRQWADRLYERLAANMPSPIPLDEPAQEA